MFRIILPLIVLFIQFVLHRRGRSWLKWKFPHQPVLKNLLSGAFVIFNLAFLYVIIQRPQLLDVSPWFKYACVYPFYLWHGSSFLIGLGLFITSIIKLPFQVALGVTKLIPSGRRQLEQLRSTDGYEKFDASRRVFLRRSFYGLTAVSVAGTAYGLLLEKHSHEIIDTDIVLDNLDPALDGFTIGMVSDIHSSIFMSKNEMDVYAKLVNGLGADLIVVPGDFITSMIDEVYPFAEAFSALKAPHGVYGVMGNHDFYNRDPDRVAREVDECGITLLRNDKAVIDKGGGKFYLFGIDDAGRSNLAQSRIDIAAKNATAQIPRVLLCHRPYFLEDAAEKNIDLVLSGHTHGGQVVFGQFGDVTIAPASLASRYIWGKYRSGNTQMYVSRGIGTVGLPIRLNCPPEITRITLRSTVA